MVTFRNVVKTRNYYTEMFGIPTQPRNYLSAPYQMSKVTSTLHQLIRDWSDEVCLFELILVCMLMDVGKGGERTLLYASINPS